MPRTSDAGSLAHRTGTCCLLGIALVLLGNSPALAQTPQRGVRVPASSAAPAAASGSYYALIIGINQYRQPLPNLKTAVNDAEEMSRILAGRYGFRVKLLLNTNANRPNILNSLSEYRRVLRENDNLLIYYAGHGHLDPDGGKAYWLPADADSDSTANWIIADELTTDIRVLPARHVLIISDSCYSGGLTRDANADIRPTDRNVYLNRMWSGKSRTLMASGGNEPVADGGPGGHSVFAAAVLNALQQSSASAFTASDLFHDFIQRQVAGRSDQVPRYSPIRNSADDEGDFVFIRPGASLPGVTAPGKTSAELPGSRIETGSIWEEMQSSPTDVVVLVRHGKTIIAADRSGQIQRSPDDGAHWTAQKLSLSTTIATLASCGPLMFAGDSGYGAGTAIFVSEDDGVTWRPTTLKGNRVTALACSGRTVFASMRRRPEAQSQPGSSAAIDPASPAGIYSREMGRLYGKTSGMEQEAVVISTDGGNTWTVSNPAFTAYKIAVEQDRPELWGLDLQKYNGITSTLFYCLHTQTWTCSTAKSRFSGAAPKTFQRLQGTVYAGTSIGSIMVSTDDGKTWDETRLPIESPGARQYGPQHDEVVVMTVAGNRVAAGTRSEGVFLLKGGAAGATMIGSRPLAGLQCLYFDGTYLYAGTKGSVYRLRMAEAAQ